MLLEKKSMPHENKYEWEEKMLQKKFLIFYNIGTGYQIIKELEIVKRFKKGIRKIFFIIEYLEEYTTIMDAEKGYMIKGMTSNIDEIIPYNELPYIALTTVLAFEDKLIYDSLFFSMDIDFGMNFKKVAEEDYQNKIKYYHL